MTNLLGKSASGQKIKRQKKNPKYLAWLHEQSCVVCQRFGESQNSPTQAHHCIHDRFGTNKAVDDDAIPLCEGHHQGLWDTTKLALHQDKNKWREQYGPDHSYIEVVSSRYPK